MRQTIDRASAAVMPGQHRFPAFLFSELEIYLSITRRDVLGQPANETL